jgi:hypothetical protein
MLLRVLTQRVDRARGIRWGLLLCFLVNTLVGSVLPAGNASAELLGSWIHVPGIDRAPLDDFPLLEGVKFSAQQPLDLELLLTGSAGRPPLTADVRTAIEYFLAFVTIPEEEYWVNLSPVESGRIIPEALGRTRAGRDLLSMDYVLKQVSSSMTDPSSRLGKLFWARVYARAMKLYGTTDIPVEILNRVWFSPEKAVIYEKDGAALLASAALKVELAEDRGRPALSGTGSTETGAPEGITRSVYRDMMIPLLNKEMNEGKEFAPARQIFHALVLAQWFKRQVRRNILLGKYGDQRKLMGIGHVLRSDIDAVYARYIQAYVRGAYHSIGESLDPGTGDMVPRKYFSGGFEGARYADYAQVRPVSSVFALPEMNVQNFFRVDIGLKALRAGDPVSSGDASDAAQSGAGAWAKALCGVIVLSIAAGVFAPAASAAIFERAPDGQSLVVTLERGDTLGQIIKDLKDNYRARDPQSFSKSAFNGKLWSPKGGIVHQIGQHAQVRHFWPGQKMTITVDYPVQVPGHFSHAVSEAVGAGHALPVAGVSGVDTGSAIMMAPSVNSYSADAPPCGLFADHCTAAVSDGSAWGAFVTAATVPRFGGINDIQLMGFGLLLGAGLRAYYKRYEDWGRALTRKGPGRSAGAGPGDELERERLFLKDLSAELGISSGGGDWEVLVTRFSGNRLFLSILSSSVLDESRSAAINAALAKLFHQGILRILLKPQPPRPEDTSDMELFFKEAVLKDRVLTLAFEPLPQDIDEGRVILRYAPAGIAPADIYLQGFRDSFKELKNAWAACFPAGEKAVDAVRLRHLLRLVQQWLRQEQNDNIRNSDLRARRFRVLEELSAAAFRRLSPSTEREYFRWLFNYARSKQFIAGHEATMDTYKSAVFEEDNKIAGVVIHSLVKEMVWRVFLFKSYFEMSLARIMRELPRTVRLYNGLADIANEIFSSTENAVAARPGIEAQVRMQEAAVRNFADRLRNPLKGSVIGPDETRRHTYLVYLGTYAVTFAVSFHRMLENVVDGLHGVILYAGHFVFNQCLVKAVTPRLLDKKYSFGSGGDLRLALSDEEISLRNARPWTHAVVAGPFTPDRREDALVSSGKGRVDFRNLSMVWERCLESPELDEQGLSEVAHTLLRYMEDQPPDFSSFSVVLSQYAGIKRWSLETSRRINGDQRLARYKEFFLDWGFQVDSIRVAMIGFSDLYVIKDFYLPPLGYGRKTYLFQWWAQVAIRIIHGISFRAFLARAFTEAAIRQILKNYDRIAQDALDIGIQAPERKSFELGLVTSYKMTVLKYISPRRHELAGKNLYQRVYTLSSLGAYLLTLGVCAAFFPGVFLYQVVGTTLLSSSITLYVVNYFLRPLQSTIGWMREHNQYISTLRRLEKEGLVTPGAPASSYGVVIEDALLGLMYILGFFAPLYTLTFATAWLFLNLPSPQKVRDGLDEASTAGGVARGPAGTGGINIEAPAQAAVSAPPSGDAPGGFDGGMYDEYAQVHLAGASAVRQIPSLVENTAMPDLEGLTFEIRALIPAGDPVVCWKRFFGFV